MSADNHGDKRDAVGASGKRKFLAVYLDFVILNTVGGLCRQIAGLNDAGTGYEETVLAVAGATLLHFIKRLSLGRRLLSIAHDNSVPVSLKIKENYWLMTLGVLFFLEGSKQLVRWTYQTPWPEFGFSAESSALLPITISFGLLWIVAGALLLKLDVRGLHLSYAALVMNFVSSLMSGDLITKAVKDRVIEKHALRGTVPHEYEYVFMQNAITFGGILFLAAALTILYLNRKHFSKSIHELES